MLDFQSARWLIDKEIPWQAGNNHPTSIPTGVFETSDGYMNIAVAGGPIWHRFCEVIGRPEWLEDQNYIDSKSRSDNRDLLSQEINNITKTENTETWIEKLN